MTDNYEPTIARRLIESADEQASLLRVNASAFRSLEIIRRDMERMTADRDRWYRHWKRASGALLFLVAVEAFRVAAWLWRMM